MLSNHLTFVSISSFVEVLAPRVLLGLFVKKNILNARSISKKIKMTMVVT